MVCLQLAAFAPLKDITVWMSVMFLLSLQTGFGEKQTTICRPLCTGSECITVNQQKADFETAEAVCRESMGELLTFQSGADEHILDMLSQELFENFWIGLRLPAGACNNLSAPLRGYEWTSGNTNQSFIPSQTTWRENVTVCSQHCVSLSNDHKWTESPCSEKINGFLCKTKHKHACRAPFFQSSSGCRAGPCQHTCKDVKGGYICSCFNGYIPNSKDPRQCQIYCGQQKCPQICEGGLDSECICPEGYILHDNKFCEDINECEMGYCDQNCKNTFGSFVCSCEEGFVLKEDVKCQKKTQDIIATTVAVGFVKPAGRNNTLKDSAAAGGSFMWIWVVVAVVVVVSIFVIRLYVVKCRKYRERHLNQQSTAVDNIVT
ncbi:matrilin-2 [Mugil cephalus]|uniref:matrilin-2 n=1 Tax=Mugil cephalus TaxID=48193 RepID=UPI001FB76812|nr:matrilin-2 [Mugil cephalus]